MAGPEHKPVSPMGGVKAFSCPNCGGQVQLRAPGQTLSAACQHCSSVIDLSDENLRILQKAESKMTRKPVIQIGKRGKLYGHEWEVVGFMVRKVSNFEYYWEEYLLFNPWQGFRWLVNNYGHWSWVEPLMEYPDYNPGSKVAHFQGTRFKMFSRGGAIVNFVLGEFYWKVKRGDSVKTADLVSPPYMLSYEVDGNGSSWSQGVYIEPKYVQEAFEVKKMPFRRRIGANQPNKAKKNWRAVRGIWFLLLAAVVVLQIFFYSNANHKVVFNSTVNFSKENPEFVSPRFKIEGKTSNVQVEFRAPSLSNNWVYLDGYLHDPNNKKNYGFTKEWEYYYGRDGGENWTEGSRIASRIINNIPAGEYELVLNSQVGAATGEPVDVAVLRDVPFMSNFWMVLLGISLMPIWLFIKSYLFEKTRWEEAD